MRSPRPATPPTQCASSELPCGFVDRPAGAGFPTERLRRSPVDGRMDNPAGCPRGPPTGRRLPTSSTGPYHHGRRRARQTPSLRPTIGHVPPPEKEPSNRTTNPHPYNLHRATPAHHSNRSRSRNHRSRSPKYALACAPSSNSSIGSSACPLPAKTRLICARSLRCTTFIDGFALRSSMAVSFGSSVEVGKSDSVEFAGNRRLSSNYAWDITTTRLAEHAPRRDVAERRQLLAQEFGERCAGNHPQSSAVR